MPDDIMVQGRGMSGGPGRGGFDGRGFEGRGRPGGFPGGGPGRPPMGGGGRPPMGGGRPPIVRPPIIGRPPIGRPRPPFRPGRFPIFFPIVIRPPQCFYIDQFGRCCDRNGWCCDQFGRCGWDYTFGGYPAMAPMYDDGMDDMGDYPVMAYGDFDMDDDYDD